jgi:nicotinic acid mononucleotide adenylyltransferase
VVARPGAAPTQAGDGQQVSRVAGPGLDVSSSAIRQLVRERRSVRYLVAPSVADYIEKRGLYR